MIRLPESILILALMLPMGATVISGGVNASQALGGAGWASVDWTFFLCSAGAFALVVLVWLFAPIDWIGDRELKDMELDESMEEYRDESRRPFFTLKLQLAVAFAALLAGYRWMRLLGGDRVVGPKDLTLDAGIRNGGNGAAFLGRTFGSVRLFGQDWTGVELAIILPLLMLLGWTLWRGFAHVVKANRRGR
jgi:hypothetical protein